jgi:hypothetical protein
MSRLRTAWAGSLLAVALLPGSAYGSTHNVQSQVQAQGQAQPTRQVIATGLDNPRGVDVFGGAVYVAESGDAGDQCFGEGDARRCYGTTGAITRIKDGTQRQIITGLPSGGVVGGTATGPHDVAAGAGGQVLAAIGLAPDIAPFTGNVPFGDRFSTLARLAPAPAQLADLRAYENANDPDGGDPATEGLQSNAFSVVVTGNGTKIVADAAANALIRVSPTGVLGTLAVFPSRCAPPPGQPPAVFDPVGAEPCPAGMIRQQGVPTGVVQGPDGAFYVGELTGFPFTVGTARIWRVTAGGQKSVVADGLTTVIDLAFDPRGRLYALEYAKDGFLAPGIEGALIRVGTGGQPHTTVLDQGLPKATGFDIGPDGAAYIAARGVPAPPAVPPNAGEVVRVRF